MGVNTAKDVNAAVALRAKMRKRYEKWARYTTWPMFILSLVFVGLSGLVIAKPHGFPLEYTAHVFTIILILWALFIIDFVVRMVLSQHPLHFVKSHLFELASLAIPYLRPFLLLRYIWRLRFFDRFGTRGIRMRAIVSIALFALFFVYTISTMVWIVERPNPKANIVNWGDAMWWGFTTITTVGYGDYTPVTWGGRSLAVLLMIGGIFVLGVTSATVISSLSEELNTYVTKQAKALSIKTPTNPKPHHSLMINALSLGAALPITAPTPTVSEGESGTQEVTKGNPPTTDS